MNRTRMDLVKFVFAIGFFVTVIVGGTQPITAGPRLLDFQGDVRFREEFSQLTRGADRWRSRVRFRLGSEVLISGQSRIKFGFASGSRDPRSTNATFTGAFSSTPVAVDYVYLDQALLPGLKLFLGKMKNPIVGDYGLFFDSDIRPDGIALKGDYLLEHFTPFITTGFFILNESSGQTADPTMLVIQPGITTRINGAESVFTVAYYRFSNVQSFPRILFPGESPGNLTNGNSIDGASKLIFDYNTIGLTGSLKFPEIFDHAPLIKIVGQFMYNPDPDQTAGLVGFKIGTKKVARPGDWQTFLNWRYLHADAWLDIFPDADAFFGGTNAKGFQLGAAIGVAPDVALRLTAFLMESINGPKTDRDVYQFDVVVSI